MRALTAPLLALAGLLLALSCASTQKAGGGGPSAQRDARFPTSEELEGIAARPVPEALQKPPQEWDVSSWTLAGPLPDGIATAPHPPANAIEELLAKEASGRSDVALSEGMHCVAREVGRFYLTHATYPGDRVRSFIVSRCGATPVGTSFRIVHGDLEGWEGEELVPPEWLPNLEALVSSALPPGPGEAGIAFVKEGTRVAILLAAGARRAALDAVTLVPDEHGAVVVSGVLLIPAHKVLAAITQGRFEAIDCAPDPEVTLPRFQFVCPTNPADELARIEVASFVEGRVLGERLVNLLARPSGAAAERYERFRYAPPRVVTDLASADEALLELLNQVRREAGLPELSLEPSQDRTAKHLAPHFFGALAAEDDEVMDQIALGMMAGWDVRGVVRSGSIAWSMLQRSQDLAEMLSAALESPSARQSLLSRDVDRVALGVVTLPEHDVVGALFGAYSVYQPTAFEAEAARAYSLLAEKRVAAGAEPPRRLVKAEPIVLEVAKSLEGGAITTSRAMELMSRRSAVATGSGIRSFVLPARSLDELELPKELLLEPAVDVAMAVAHTKKEGEAWGHLVVLVVMKVDGPVRTAALDDGSSPQSGRAALAAGARSSPAT